MHNDNQHNVHRNNEMPHHTVHALELVSDDSDGKCGGGRQAVLCTYKKNSFYLCTYVLEMLNAALHYHVSVSK